MTAALALAPKASTRLFLDVERSVCGRPWRDRLDERATARALAIAQRHNVPELLARILAGRGVEVDEVEAFLDPTVRRLMPDPHTVTAMEQAAQRIADAMLRGEQVAIFGDYDVDGATASALLARFLRDRRQRADRAYPRPDFRRLRPERRGDPRARRRAARRCSSPSIAAPPASSRWPRRGGSASTSIVIDHHQADEQLPDAIVVNPNRLDDLSGLGHLAAVGLVFLTVVAVNRELRTRGFWTRGAAGAGPARLARHRRARHRRRRGAAQGPQPRLRRQGPAGAAPPRQRRPHRADGRGAARRPAGAVASRLPARAAHQRRRPHRPRRSRRRCCCAPTIRSRPARIAAELDRLNRERQAIEVAMLAEAEAEAHGRARHRGEGRGGGDGRGELASGRGRACSRRG